MSTIILLPPVDPARLAEVKAHAAINVFDMTQRPFPPPPGDDPRHVLWVGPYRIVYSHSLSACMKDHGCDRRSHLFHHFSISQHDRPGIPSPVEAASLIYACGVMGVWSAAGVNEDERTAVVLVEIDPAKAKA